MYIEKHSLKKPHCFLPNVFIKSQNNYRIKSQQRRYRELVFAPCLDARSLAVLTGLVGSARPGSGEPEDAAAAILFPR